MAQVTNKYGIPTSIYWETDQVPGNNRAANTRHAGITRSRTTLYVTWYSPCVTFQAQWRRRRRYSPAKALAVSLTGADVWEEWGEWEGSDLSEDAAVIPLNPMVNYRVLDVPFEIPYDFSEYDRYEYQVRVRVIDEPSLLCSEWAYETLVASFEPEWSFGDVTRRADGGLDAEIVCNSLRPFQFKLGRVRKNYKTVGSWNEWVSLPAGGGAVSIPASAVGAYDEVDAGYANIKTYDGRLVFGQDDYLVVGQAPDDETITAPVVAFEDTNLSTRATVEDAGYDNVFVTAQWEDAYGNPHVESLEVTGAWEAAFPAPAYGVEITYFVTTVVGGKWRTSTFIRTFDGKGRMSFANGEDYVELMYDTSWKADASLEGEYVKCAGREKPVARHGEGATNKVTAQGTLLSSRATGTRASSAWLPEVQLLKSNRTWLYRSPLGERMNVMVNSVATSSEHPDIITLSISMTEVE